MMVLLVSSSCCWCQDAWLSCSPSSWCFGPACCIRHGHARRQAGEKEDKLGHRKLTRERAGWDSQVGRIRREGGRKGWKLVGGQAAREEQQAGHALPDQPLCLPLLADLLLLLD